MYPRARHLYDFHGQCVACKDLRSLGILPDWESSDSEFEELELELLSESESDESGKELI